MSQRHGARDPPGGKPPYNWTACIEETDIDTNIKKERIMKELVVEFEQMRQEYAVELESLRMPDQLMCLIPELLEYLGSPSNLTPETKEEYVYVNVSDGNGECLFLALVRCYALGKECLIVRRCYNKEEAVDTLVQDYNSANINNNMGYLILKMAKEHLTTVKDAIDEFVSTHKWTRERYKWLGD